MNAHGERQGLRYAALTLHALAASDRDWVLGSLPLDQSRVLGGMLRELQELGIPPDEDLLRAAAPAQAVTGVPDNRQVLDGCAARVLAAALQSEPAGLTCTLLATHRWRWTDELMGALDPQLALRVTGATEALPGPALTEALVAALLRRIPSAKQEPAQRTSVWARAARRVGWRRDT